jgi:hypothetical protein
VALVWQDLLARLTATPLRSPARIVLGLTVWAVYLADRVLDVRLPAVSGEAPRHRFYRRHRPLAIVLLGAVLLGDAAVTVAFLRPSILRNGFVILVAVLVYLGAVHGGFRWRLPKEFLVALLFTAGTFLVAWTWAPRPLETLLLPAAVFFSLCLANLTAIESWEWRELRRGKDTGGRSVVLGLAPWMAPALAGLAAACLVAGVRLPFYRAAGTAAALLWLIWTSGRRGPLDARRVLVDAALLTPLLFRL